MSSTDNQQERLIKLGWITGFVDGEGCFSIGFIKQSDRQELKRVRRGYKTGYQVAHEFAVTQGEKSLASLKILKEYFEVGNIFINKRHDNHKEHLYRFVVRKRQDLIKVIIPFFKKYPLQTSKRESFEKFSKCVEMINEYKHLNLKGLLKIVNISSTMNRRKSREDLIRILRDHMPTLAKVK